MEVTKRWSGWALCHPEVWILRFVSCKIGGGEVKVGISMKYFAFAVCKLCVRIVVDYQLEILNILR